MTLTEFLLARIAEDEAAAHEPWCDDTSDVIGGRCSRCEASSVTRVLAECEAKREVIAECRIAIEREDTAGRGGTSVPWGVCMNILRHMALPYADHPDHDEALRA